MFSRPKKQKQVIIDRQILALHEAMASKVVAHPHLFDDLFQNLEERYTSGMMSYGSYLLWHGILELRYQPKEFCRTLLATDPRTAGLRRKTIMTGILNEEEREAALAQYIASELSYHE